MKNAPNLNAVPNGPDCPWAAILSQRHSIHLLKKAEKSKDKGKGRVRKKERGRDDDNGRERTRNRSPGRGPGR